MTLLDDYSSFAHVVLLRSKSEAAPKMVELLTMLMNQCGKCVKRITSDRGGEYVSEELQKFFRTNGIQWTPSVPQQNGRAERLNRTLHEKAQAICSSACILDSWWDFAINTATHVYNRTPMSRLHWSLPYELFKGMKPKVDHF
jgi:IS30 family transposase